MTGAKFELLVCPACHGRLELGSKDLGCARGHRYDIEDDIPVLLAAPPSALVQKQADWFDRHTDEEWEIERPRGAPTLYGWLLEEKFRRAVRDVQLRNRTALAVCAGSGMDAEFLACAEADVIALDVSLGAARRAAERARRHGFDALLVVGDATQLPLPDASVDVVYVHDGLHHLEDPLVGLGEMARVSRHAVCVSEPARARVTSLAIRMGLALQREEAGNPVGRLDPKAIAAELRERGFHVVRSQRYGMYYRHEPGRLVGILSRPGLIHGARAGFRLANAVAGRFGNKLALVAVRR